MIKMKVKVQVDPKMLGWRKFLFEDTKFIIGTPSNYLINMFSTVSFLHFTKVPVQISIRSTNKLRFFTVTFFVAISKN